MKNLHKTIGFIGAGTMGEAMISALIQAGVFAASAITASDVSPDRLDSLKRSYGIQVTEDNFSLFSACDIVIVLFWSRMGTPLPHPEYQKADGSPYLSGTEWEFWDAVNAERANGKPITLIYRRTEKRVSAHRTAFEQGGLRRENSCNSARLGQPYVCIPGTGW